MLAPLEPPDRCAAYVAALHALAAASHARWPDGLALDARAHAIASVRSLAEALGYEHGSPSRRRCARAACASALQVAALCDIARATGAVDRTIGEVQRRASRAVAVIALFCHANAYELV